MREKIENEYSEADNSIHSAENHSKNKNVNKIVYFDQLDETVRNSLLEIE